MTAIVQTLIDPSAASLYGTAALAARMVSPLFANREQILTAQLGSSCLFAASYAVMDQRTATSVCLIGAIQTTVTLIAGERAWLNRMGYVFLPVVLVMGAVTYSGLPTLLAVTACGPNSPPSAVSVVTITPERPRTGDDLVGFFEEDATDENGDSLDYTYRWLTDGQPANIDDLTVTSDLTHKLQVVDTEPLGAPCKPAAWPSAASTSERMRRQSAR